jgi:hypothetical protein
MVSDGCTGFWFAELFFDIRQCCVVHDTGGTDELLTYCLMNFVPVWLWPIVLLCVALMLLFKPIYRRFKPQVTWFYQNFIAPLLKP